MCIVLVIPLGRRVCIVCVIPLGRRVFIVLVIPLGRRVCVVLVMFLGFLFNFVRPFSGGWVALGRASCVYI